MLVILGKRNIRYIYLEGKDIEFIKDLSADEIKDFFFDELKLNLPFHIYMPLMKYCVK